MEQTIWIPLTVFLSILIGGVGRVIKGYLDAAADGEAFNLFKFLSTLVSTFFAACLAFAGVQLSDIAVGPTGLIVLIVGSLVLGFYGSKDMGKTAVAIGGIK